MQVKFALAAVMTIALSAAQAQAKDSDDYRIVLFSPTAGDCWYDPANQELV